MKFLILLLYYNRPKMVQNALRSIANLQYDDWELAFIDDGSALKADEHIDNILKDRLQKVKKYTIADTIDDKVRRGGSQVGNYMNLAAKESDADLAIMLCDDDALLPTYFENASRWFTNNPTKAYGFCDVVLFDPFVEQPGEFTTDYINTGNPNPKFARLNRYKNFMNKGRSQVKPMNCLDASQVVWRTNIHQQNNVWFPYPKTANIDCAFYGEIYKHYGYCPFMGFAGQYKGLYASNLGKRKNAYDTIDLP